MDADEQDICNYLKQWPKQFISGREIARRAGGKRRSRNDPFWANAVLSRMVEKQILETDRSGHFRILQKEVKPGDKKWISPELQKLLEESGKKFSGTIEIEEPEEPHS